MFLQKVKSKFAVQSKLTLVKDGDKLEKPTPRKTKPGDPGDIIKGKPGDVIEVIEGTKKTPGSLL